MDISAINGIFNGILNKGRTTLTEVEGYDVFNLCGIKTPAYKLFTNGKEAGDFVEAQLKAGKGRFVAKVVSPDVRALNGCNVDYPQDRCGWCCFEHQGR